MRREGNKEVEEIRNLERGYRNQLGMVEVEKCQELEYKVEMVLSVA